MGVIPPDNDFLQSLRKLCNEAEVLLILDEVITGFRVARGGAQEIYRVRPDLTCLGKVIGGGMNIAAYGGRKEIMELISPLGPVYQAGTLAGNPVAVAAGIATLDTLKPSMYVKSESTGSKLERNLKKSAERVGVTIKVQRVGSMLGLFFVTDEAGKSITNYDEIMNRCSKEMYSKFFNTMIENGIYFPPSAFETIFVSTAHSFSDISDTTAAADISFQRLEIDNSK